MCGICGVYSMNMGKSDGKLFRHLLMVNSFRGMDSTGVVRGDKKTKKFNFVKTLSPSPRYVTSDSCRELTDAKATETLLYLGHTRSATRGTVTQNNAHPFMHDGIIGVHNGTILRNFPFSDKFETDSEALLRLIADRGIVDALSEVSGGSSAYAIVWVDLKDRTLNFVRNAKRPLHFTYVAGRTVLAWSSDAHHLEFICEHNNLTMSGYHATDKSEDSRVFTLNPHDLLSIDIGNPAVSAKVTQLEGIEDKSVFTSGYSGASTWEDWEAGEYGTGSVTYQGGSKAVGFSIGGEYTDKPDEWMQGSDGIWRKRKEEMVRLHTIKRKTEEALSKKTEQGASISSTPEDMKSLSWLDANKKKGVAKGTDPFHYQEPQSQHERNFRLSQGCFACGCVVHHEDAGELAKVRWWNREHYVCGDCWDTSEGDWVQSAFKNDIPIFMN